MSEDAKKKAIELYVSGKTVAQVARELEVRANLVWNWVDRAGVRRPSKRSQHMEAAIAAYLDGTPITKVAAEAKVSVSTVQGWVSTRGLTGKGGRAAKTSSNKQSALLLYREGKLYSEIAKALKVAPKTVSKWVEDAGIVEEGGAHLQARRDAESAVRLYTEKNATIEDIATHLGRGVNTVSGWLRDAEVEVKSSIERRTSAEQAMYSKLGVAANIAKAQAEPRPTKICAHCEETFELPQGRRQSRQQYCSPECSQLGRRNPDKRTQHVCEVCKEPFERFASVQSPNRFCSNACRIKSSGKIQWKYEDNVLDSGYEAMFAGLCSVYGVPCERFDRAQGVNWEGERWYAPDFLVKVGARSVAVEIKGLVREVDEPKWAAFREKSGVPFVVLTQEQLVPPPATREDLLALLGLDKIVKS
ncbi:helix-turn-helix domain-containing protein [Streptomyces mirabilis]|uniref:helix-turn-helix domain-containing protein n=1 Tax=Streptomyces mirabilis TaxID=68239 RepID=UPI0036B01867